MRWLLRDQHSTFSTVHLLSPAFFICTCLVCSAPPSDNDHHVSNVLTPGDIMLSAFGAQVVNRSSGNANQHSYNGKSIIVNAGALFPRPGKVIGWRAFFTNTEMSVDFQIWRRIDDTSHKSGTRFRLIGKTGPLISPKVGLRVFRMENLGLEPLTFQITDTIGLGFETGVPLAFDVRRGSSCAKYLLSDMETVPACRSALFQPSSESCERFSVQALVVWTDEGNSRCKNISSTRRPATSEGNSGGSLSEMPVYEMACQTVYLTTPTAEGVLDGANYTGVPLIEDLCWSLKVNFADKKRSPQSYAIQIDVLEITRRVEPPPVTCTDYDGRVDIHDGMSMTSRVIRRWCVRQDDDHVVTVCRSGVLVHAANRFLLRSLHIKYSIIPKAGNLCNTIRPAAVKTRKPSTAAIVAIVVISAVSLLIAVGVARLSRRGAPLFRIRKSPMGSEISVGLHEETMYRTSLSSPSSSWPENVTTNHRHSMTFQSNADLPLPSCSDVIVVDIEETRGLGASSVMSLGRLEECLDAEDPMLSLSNNSSPIMTESKFTTESQRS